MKLTIHTDYALRLLMYLAVDELPMPTVRSVSAYYGVSSTHLAKVAQLLVQLGYVTSARGRHGGLRLERLPETIGLGRLVRETENLVLLECFGEHSTCRIESACRLKGILYQAQQAFLDVLDHYTLADLVSHPHELRALLALPGSPEKGQQKSR